MLVSGRVVARSSYSESCLRGLFGSKKQRSIPMTRPTGMQPGFSPYLIPLHSTWKYLTLQESAKKYLYPKYHQISKLVVWRSQNPAIQSQTPLYEGPTILRVWNFDLTEYFRFDQFSVSLPFWQTGSTTKHHLFISFPYSKHLPKVSPGYVLAVPIKTHIFP